jgi:hypothetical protein
MARQPPARSAAITASQKASAAEPSSRSMIAWSRPDAAAACCRPGRCQAQSRRSWAAAASHKARPENAGARAARSAASSGAATFIRARCWVICSESAPRSLSGSTSRPAAVTIAALISGARPRPALVLSAMGSPAAVP